MTPRFAPTYFKEFPVYHGPIGLDSELVLDMIKRTTAALDEYPDPERISETLGPEGDIATLFKSPLNMSAGLVALRAEELRKDLVTLDSAIRATMDDFVAQDESVQNDARRFLAILKDAAPPAPETDSSSTVSETLGTVAKKLESNLRTNR